MLYKLLYLNYDDKIDLLKMYINDFTYKLQHTHYSVSINVDVEITYYII